MKRSNPWCEFPCSPDELVRAVCFGDIEATATELGIPAQELAYYRTGRKPVPKVVYLWLRHRSDTQLGHQFGPFRGFQLDDRGDALICPATGERINYDDVAMMRDYRNAQRLATQQATLIERLMVERDFYRENCHRQARFGMLLNRILGED